MAHSARSIADIRADLAGPVNSLPTPFTAQLEIDLAALRRLIDAGIAGGSKVALLTAGDSQFEFLTDAEVATLTRTLADHANGRALTVAATRNWPTPQAVEFAHCCVDWGIDLLMLTTGPHAQQLAPAELAAHYRAVAAVIPVMIVGFPPHALLDALADVPSVCAFKEDGSIEYSVDTMRRYGDRFVFMSGGGLWRNYTQWPFGCRAFMSPWAHLGPHVDRVYYHAMLGNDLRAAADIIARVDWPLFDLCPHYPGSWQSLWRGLLELKGLATRHVRPPRPTLSDADLARLKQSFTQLLLPR